MHLKAGLSSLACALVSTSAIAADNSLAIASTSLCGDGYMLAIAPNQVSALSWQSRDALSTATDAEKSLPQIWDDPEVLIGSQADIIVFGPGEGGFAKNLPQKTISLEWGEGFDTVIRNIEKLTESSSFADTLKLRLSDLNKRGAARQEKPKILYLSRAGGTAGPGTYVDAAITAAGGANVVSVPNWSTPDPEQILSYAPDIIVTSFFTDGYESVQSNGVRHTAIRDFIAARPQVDIPGKLWPCAGPGLIEAAELIADGLDALP